MNNTTTEFDFDRSVSEAHLAASGWEPGLFLHSNPFECHALYVCDYRTGRVDFFSTKMTDLQNAKVLAPADEMGGIVAGLMEKHQNDSMTEQEGAFFLPSLLSYIKDTRTFAQWCKQAPAGARLHFALNIYPRGKQGTVRPYALHETGTVVPVAKLITAANQVRDHDHANFPEWFAGYPVNELNGSPS